MVRESVTLVVLEHRNGEQTSRNGFHDVTHWLTCIIRPSFLTGTRVLPHLCVLYNITDFMYKLEVPLLVVCGGAVVFSGVCLEDETHTIPGQTHSTFVNPNMILAFAEFKRYSFLS